MVIGVALAIGFIVTMVIVRNQRKARVLGPSYIPLRKSAKEGDEDEDDDGTGLLYVQKTIDITD
jgi:hypothetical protein